jgi:hypothetical protein
MIRIDEIYNNTFWPWLRDNRPGHRLFFCDPFGRSDADSVQNYGSDTIHEHNYIFLFDQEPIHLGIHMTTFNHVAHSNLDITHTTDAQDQNRKCDRGYLITSERDSGSVNFICKKFGWVPKYYFFHGWAALDWYRGYDKTFLMPSPEHREILKTFIAPNRIIAGMRQHRLQMLYWIFKLDMTDNWISCPETCPAENITIADAIAPLAAKYSDIEDVFATQTFPISFPGETDAPMHSCWLSLFDESASSLLYLVTETVATHQRHHLTEKTFKPICLRMPFVLVATRGSLAYLRSYGFRTFGDFWDESYDDESDDDLRVEKIARLLKQLDTKTQEQKQQLFDSMQEVLEHNYNHFYGGAFEQILWDEFNDMLNSIEVSV